MAVEAVLTLPPEALDLLRDAKVLIGQPKDPTVQILQLWKGVGTAYSGLWTFYVVGASATLGYVFSDKYVKVATTAKLALFALFAIFALANLVSVWQNLRVFNAATAHLVSVLQHQAAVSEMRGTIEGIATSIWITPIWLVVLLHVAVDACVLRIVWLRAHAADPESRKAASIAKTGGPGGNA